MRASGGLRAWKQAGGTPSETSFCSGTVRRPRAADICCGQLRDRRRRIGLEPWRATLAGHPNTTTTTTNTSTSPPPDCLWLKPSSQGCGLMLLLLFFVLRTGASAKMASRYNNKTWRGLFFLYRILYWYKRAPTTMSVDNQQPVCRREGWGWGQNCDLFSPESWASVIVRHLSLHSSLSESLGNVGKSLTRPKIETWGRH